MRMRRTSLSVSLLSLTLLAAAVAQDPLPNRFAQPSLFTQPGSVAAEESSLLNGSCPDGWNLDWQWRFQADALYLKRNRDWRDIPVITGPESFRPSNLDFDYKAGTRLSLGIMQDDFEMDFVFSALNDWTASQSGVLTHAVDFDGPVAYDAAPLAQPIVNGPDLPNFITSGTYFAPINTATLTGAEANELEFLRPGARFSQSFNSNYQDFEVNYKRRAQPGRFARFGFGYRNVQFGESGLTALSGTFDTVDSATGLEAADNNGLSNGALVSGGLTAPTPALLGVGFNENSTIVPAIPPDELLFTTQLRANNQLNGVHLTSDFLFFESEYFELGGFGKAGVFHNFASGSITERYSDTLNDPNSVYTRTLSSKKEVASFLGQAGLTGRLFLRENVRLFGSYEALYLSGLALAPDQMRGISTSVTPAASLDLRTQGSVFIHGGRIGVEILWP